MLLLGSMKQVWRAPDDLHDSNAVCLRRVHTATVPTPTAVYQALHFILPN
jgi:hypothetical protein